MVLFLLLGLVIYVISVVKTFSYTRTSHSIGGKYEKSDPNVGDIFLCFIPVINTIYAIVTFFRSPNKGGSFSKFFKVER